MSDLYAALLDAIEYAISWILQFSSELFSTFYHFFLDLLGELRSSFVNIGLDFFSLLDEDFTSDNILSTDLIFWALGLMVVVYLFKPLLSFISDRLP